LPSHLGTTESDSILRLDVLVGQIMVDLATCQGCACCVEGCPEGVLIMVVDPDGIFSHPDVLDPASCLGCRACEGRCPTGSIRLSIGFESEERDAGSGEHDSEDAPYWT
jgi:NAD-dependent dihydropyrimidine dehydrogenase PreA subunit